MDNLFNVQDGHKHKKYKISKDEILKFIRDKNVMSYESVHKHKDIMSVQNVFNGTDNVLIAFFYNKESNQFYRRLCILDGVDIKSEFLRQYSFEIGGLKKQLDSLQPKKILDDIACKFNDSDEDIRLEIRSVINNIKKTVADISFVPRENNQFCMFKETDYLLKKVAEIKVKIKEYKRALAIAGDCRQKLITTVFKVLRSKYAVEIINEIEKGFQPKRRKNNEQTY